MNKLITLCSNVILLIFFLGTIISVLLLLAIFSIINHSFVTPLLTLLIGGSTIGVIWWQGTLLKEQIQFQSYLELEKEWNSREMLNAREELSKCDPFHVEPYKLEAVLEFLEKFSLFKKRNAMDMDFILSSAIGWYAVRYYYYYKKNIESLRELYKDEALYEDLTELYNDYLEHEGCADEKSKNNYEQNMKISRKAFIENESVN